MLGTPRRSRLGRWVSYPISRAPQIRPSQEGGRAKYLEVLCGRIHGHKAAAAVAADARTSTIHQRALSTLRNSDRTARQLTIATVATSATVTPGVAALLLAMFRSNLICCASPSWLTSSAEVDRNKKAPKQTAPIERHCRF